MGEAILVLVQTAPKRLADLAKVGIAVPILIIIWYELAGNMLERFSVALVALLLMVAYGFTLTLLAARLSAETVRLKTYGSTGGSMAGQGKVPRSVAFRSLQSFAQPRGLDSEEVADSEEDESHLALPLRG